MPKYYLDEVPIPNDMNYRIFNSALENGRLKNNINVQLPEVVINKSITLSNPSPKYQRI